MTRHQRQQHCLQHLRVCFEVSEFRAAELQKSSGFRAPEPARAHTPSLLSSPCSASWTHHQASRTHSQASETLFCFRDTVWLPRHTLLIPETLTGLPDIFLFLRNTTPKRHQRQQHRLQNFANLPMSFGGVGLGSRVEGSEHRDERHSLRPLSSRYGTYKTVKARFWPR